MSIIIESGNSVHFTCSARLIDDDRDVASDWASQHIKTNKFIKWIVGRYVEADNANRNNQYWTLSDLQAKHSTVDHTPMNMGHRHNEIVGTVVASEMIYPTDESAADQNPFVETVGAFWKWYFPEQLSAIEKAYSEGSLYQSMESVSDTVTCVGEGGCGQTFDYAGPMSDTYCDCIREHRASKQLDNPHFLGTGLIIPPDRPGWTNAEINEISKMTTDDEKHRVLASIAAESPHLSPDEWEKVMWTLQFQAFHDEILSATKEHEVAVEEMSNRKPPSLIALQVAQGFMAKSRY